MPLFGTKPGWAAKESIFYLHGTVFSLWFALLAYQTFLIRQRSLRLHRKLGYAGIGLGVVVVMLGCYAGCGRPIAPAASSAFLFLPSSSLQFRSLEWLFSRSS